MRIAIFTEYYYPFISGVVTHIETLKQGLEKAGHAVLIVTLDPNSPDYYQKDGVLYCPAIPLRKVYGYGIANPLNLRRLAYVKQFNPDIIHLQTEFTMGLFAVFCAKQLKKPVVYTLHTMYDDYLFYVVPEGLQAVSKPVFRSYIRRIARQADEIIGPSVKVAEYLQLCGVRRHVNIVPNAVDISEFLAKNIQPDAVEKAKKEMGIAPEDICLIFVGRLGGEKSIDVLIKYFAKGYKGQNSFKLFLVGDGPEREALQALITSLGVEKQVHLLGRVEHAELPPYLQACNLFATASLTEMNSISLLEATASGLYALHRLDIYNRDQIRTGVNGEVFTNAKEFKEILDRYVALSPAQRAQRRESVSAYAQRYGPDEFSQLVLNVYNRARFKYERIHGRK